MRVLFAITVCCFCAVLWIALALARRIRIGQVLTAKPNPKPVRNPATREFFEAGEFRTPRPLHLDQEIFKQKPRRPLAEIHVAFERRTPLATKLVSQQAYPMAERPRNPGPIPIRPPAAAYATLFGQNVSIAQIEANNETGTETRSDARHSISPPLPSNGRTGANGSPASASVDFTQRMPPQPVRASGLRRRVDLSHFTRDMGDLTDPYTNPLRGSGTQGRATSDSRESFER